MAERSFRRPYMTAQLEPDKPGLILQAAAQMIVSSLRR